MSVGRFVMEWSHWLTNLPRYYRICYFFWSLTSKNMRFTIKDSINQSSYLYFTVDNRWYYRYNPDKIHKYIYIFNPNERLMRSIKSKEQITKTLSNFIGILFSIRRNRLSMIIIFILNSSVAEKISPTTKTWGSDHHLTLLKTL